MKNSVNHRRGPDSRPSVAGQVLRRASGAGRASDGVS